MSFHSSSSNKVTRGRKSLSSEKLRKMELFFGKKFHSKVKICLEQSHLVLPSFYCLTSLIFDNIRFYSSIKNFLELKTLTKNHFIRLAEGNKILNKNFQTSLKQKELRTSKLGKTILSVASKHIEAEKNRQSTQ